MPFGYPVMLEVHRRRCLVIGGGSIGEGKVLGLLEARGTVTVISPQFSDVLEELGRAGSIDLIRRNYRPGDMDGAFLVIAATDDGKANAQMFADAERAGILFNAVDDSAYCHFAAASTVRRGDLLIALSTGGKAPALAKRLRKRLESEFSEEYAGFLDLLAEVRERALAVRTVDFKEWARRWDVALDKDLLGMVREGRHQEAKDVLWKDLTDPDTGSVRSAGRVTIVGAGPGDPGLMTLKAAYALADADVVVYDRLVSPELITGKEGIYVGKEAGAHSMPQEQINQTLIDLASQGRKVVRLKGGDPFVFGRGAEEAEALADAGIEFSVIPAPTSAIAALSAAGIPVTDRRFASSVIIVTGHCGGGKPVNWRNIAAAADTIVVLMGVKNLSSIVQSLIEGGLDPATPAAVVENGTLPDQRVVEAPLSDLADRVSAEGIKSPAVIVVGEVVKMRARLLGAAGRAHQL